MTMPHSLANESFWDRDGHSITLDQWVVLRSDPGYVCVAYDEIGPDVVSTVWIGLSLYLFPSLNDFAPLIFETMVFPACDHCCRYASLAEAAAGHEAVCAELRVTHNL